jgi:hypothetical protein
MLSEIGVNFAENEEVSTASMNAETTIALAKHQLSTYKSTVEMLDRYN